MLDLHYAHTAPLLLSHVLPDGPSPWLLPCKVDSTQPLCPLPLQILIASHLPSYELRHNQVESIFLSAVDMYGHQFCPDNLKVRLSPSTFHRAHAVAQVEPWGTQAPHVLSVLALGCKTELQIPLF